MQGDLSPKLNVKMANQISVLDHEHLIYGQRKSENKEKAVKTKLCCKCFGNYTKVYQSDGIQVPLKYL